MANEISAELLLKLAKQQEANTKDALEILADSGDENAKLALEYKENN